MRDDSTQTVSRRQFTATAALAALSAAIAPSRVLGQDAPGKKLNLAAIGIGGMGAANLKACAGENIVALCDVDERLCRQGHRGLPESQVLPRLPRDARQGEGHRRRDHRDAGPHARRDHVPDAGRQARVLREAADAHRSSRRGVTEAARKNKVVTQMGNQGQSDQSMRLLKEWLDVGRSAM